MWMKRYRAFPCTRTTSLTTASPMKATKVSGTVLPLQLCCATGPPAVLPARIEGRGVAMPTVFAQAILGQARCHRSG